VGVGGVLVGMRRDVRGHVWCVVGVKWGSWFFGGGFRG